MAKRPLDSSRGFTVKIKRRKGARVRIATVPDSDDEGPPSNNNLEYARSVKTRASTAGKAESVTMKSVRIFETKDTRQEDLEPSVCNHEEVIAGDPPTTKKAKKQQKKKNDSVGRIVFTQCFYTNGFPDQDANLARRTVYSAR